MRFHSNQLSWAIKHPFISLCFKYHSFGFICFSTMLSPVNSSLDEISCIYIRGLTKNPNLPLCQDGGLQFYQNRCRVGKCLLLLIVGCRTFKNRGRGSGWRRQSRGRRIGQKCPALLHDIWLFAEAPNGHPRLLQKVRKEFSGHCLVL